MLATDAEMGPSPYDGISARRIEKFQRCKREHSQSSKVMDAALIAFPLLLYGYIVMFC